MAGLGTRFSKEGFDLPKPLIEVNGKSLIEHSVESLGIKGQFIFITREYENSDYNKILSDKLKSISPNSIEIKLSELTSGSVETCLKSSEFINNEEELIITNCDQRLEWSSNSFINFINSSNSDGVVVTYDSKNPKNSFVKLDDNGNVCEFAEKNPISNHALIGLHYWKHGKDFVNSGEELMKSFKQDGKPECYISETYNYLIKNGKKIKNYQIKNNEYISLGTPYDLSVYESKIKEFYSEKPKTIFCDIDGTILRHVHKFSDVVNTPPEILPGVLDKFNQWDSHGNKIILCTARKESAREITELQLKKLGLCWDQLIMGVTSGERILINDKLNLTDNNRSVSVNIITNEGFNSIKWENYKL